MAPTSSQPANSQSQARAKRRRTSPEDQLILEAAFQQNSKPDKAERTELLSKVSLGEKELSIWFQNRRQVSRRRSRPLTSDDVRTQQPPSSSSFSLEASSQDVILSQGSTPETSQDISETLPGRHSVQVGSSVTSSLDDVPNDVPSSTCDITVAMPNPSLPQSNNLGPNGLPALSTLTSASGGPIPLISKPPKASKKTRETFFTLYDESQADIQSVAPSLPAPITRPNPKPRLATSLDGSVRIMTGNSPTPSPPRPRDSLFTRQPRASGPLQRSQSAIVTPTFPVPRPAASIGRSRDSRTWEFYCDPNARDELTKQAEREQSGSAVGAIGLIRSCSKGSLSAGTRPINPQKRNATVSKPDSGKRLKADTSIKTSKPKLSRTSSSFARLQNSTSLPRTSKPNKPGRPTSADSSDKPLQYKKPTDTDLLDGNESDKENWAPGTQISVTPRRGRHRQSHTSRAKILTENQHLPSLSSSLDVLLSRESSGNGRHPRRGAKMGTRVIELEGGQENEVDRFEDEVRGFMANGGGSGENVIVGEDGDEEDLDCVEGLLKLSRGDWP
ncbi:MAG: hypothetical protein LQ349_005485 [Xanthoria aureola]|nr:MAG: hypothetical protein LQ349_005485 [Xanthoria aureola]